MTTTALTPLTHHCRNCDAHHPRHQVRQCIPAENTPEGEVEVMVCPICGSYDLEQLQEVDHAQ